MKEKGKLYTVFANIKAAYDMVDQTELLKIMIYHIQEQKAEW